MQGKYDQLDLGGYFERDPVFAGLWYRGLPVVKAYEQGYQNNDAIAVVVGYKVNDWRFGYSYDITTTNLNRYSSGTHEVMLGITFGKQPPVKATEPAAAPAVASPAP